MDKVQESAIEYDFFGQRLANEEIASQLVGGEDHFVEAFSQPVLLPFFIIQTNQFYFIKHINPFLGTLSRTLQGGHPLDPI